MTLSVRVQRIFLCLLTLAVFAGGVVFAAAPHSAKAREKLANCEIGSKVKLHLANDSEVKGRVAGFHEDAVDVMPRGSKTAITVPLADIVSGAGIRSLHG